MPKEEIGPSTPFFGSPPSFPPSLFWPSDPGERLRWPEYPTGPIARGWGARSTPQLPAVERSGFFLVLCLLTLPPAPQSPRWPPCGLARASERAGIGTGVPLGDRRPRDRAQASCRMSSRSFSFSFFFLLSGSPKPLLPQPTASSPRNQPTHRRSASPMMIKPAARCLLTTLHASAWEPVPEVRQDGRIDPAGRGRRCAGGRRPPSSRPTGPPVPAVLVLLRPPAFALAHSPQPGQTKTSRR